MCRTANASNVDYRLSRRGRKPLSCTVFLLAGLLSLPAWAADLPKATATVPAGHDEVRSDLGGAYFVAQSLKQQYDKLVGQARSLEEQILKAEIDEAEARQQITKLQEEIKRLLADIEGKQVFVSAAKIHKTTESITFQLGQNRCLFLPVGKVRLVGWDQPQVKCLLEKTVLSGAEQTPDGQFEEIKLVHHHGPATEEVGKTREELLRSIAQERGWDTTPETVEEKLAAQLKKFVEEYLADYALFNEMQGKDIDVLRIQGLTYEEGNRQIAIEMKRAEGGGWYSSQWRRHASLTVFVPKCKMVGIRGARKGIDVQSLDASLAILGEGDRDYEAAFRIKDLNGTLIVDNVPVQLLENVRGDVSIVLTVYGENVGTHYQGGSRTVSFVPPGDYIYKSIGGNFRGWFCRADLQLENVGGQVDVRNEFGKTVLVADGRLAARAHRIVSQAGHIEVRFGQESRSELPILALTECGLVRSVGSDDSLENVSFSTPLTDEGVTRSWRGFVTKDKSGHDYVFERVSDVLYGRERRLGLDLISRGGTVRLVYPR